MAHIQAFDQPAEHQGAVLAKAVTRAGERMGLSGRVIGAVIGVSEPTVSRLRKGDFALERGSKPFELSVLLVRLYRSLDAIVGGDEGVARAWLRNENTVLGGKPLDQIQTISGLLNVIAYLDARRALV